MANAARYQYEQPSYTAVFEIKISDTLQMAVKKQDQSDEKFFDLRRKKREREVFTEWYFPDCIRVWYI